MAFGFQVTPGHDRPRDAHLGGTAHRYPAARPHDHPRNQQESLLIGEVRVLHPLYRFSTGLPLPMH
jgi:hypothetical protein